MTTRKLRELCTVVMGQAPPGDSYNSDHKGLPLIAGAGDFGACTPSPKRFTTKSTKVSESGDLILCIRATIGDLNWSDRQYCLGRGVAALRPNPAKLDARYLWYWIQRSKHLLDRHAHGSTFKQVSREAVENLPTPDTSLPEQRRIAAILDKADAIRRKRQEQIREAEGLISSIFLNMFGDPVRNPKSWPMKCLSEVGRVQGGLQVTTKRRNNPIEVPYLRVANVYRDRLNLEEVKSIRVTKNELERATLKTGDVLIVEGHGNRGEVGRSAIWNGTIDPCVHQNHLIRVRLNANLANPHFINAYLNSAAGRRQLLRFAKTTSGLNTISTGNVKAIRTLVPPISLQHTFLKAVERHRKALTQLNASHIESTRLFQALAQSLFPSRD